MVTVNDNDVLLASITTAGATTITEGTAATFTVTLDTGCTAGGLTISVGVTQSGSYIVGSAPETVVIAEGATTGTLTVSTDDDSLDETDRCHHCGNQRGCRLYCGYPKHRHGHRE